MGGKRLAATAALSAVALAVTSVSAQNDWAGRTWTAYSSISMAITGDITTTPTEIVFGNGETLSVEVVQGNATGQWGFSTEIGQATVLRVTKPLNPALIEGNTLCGPQPTFLSLYVEPQGGLTLTVYSGSTVPESSQSDDVCAIYGYDPT